MMTNRLLFRNIALWLACLLGLSSGNAIAWNAAGHRLSAVIAWENMSERARAQAALLLNEHKGRPDWERQLARGKSPIIPTPLALFAEASTWADDIRRDTRYSDSADSDAEAKHRDWHYVNWTSEDGELTHRGGRLLLEIERQSKIFADSSAAASDRALAMVWLIHLVADAHQPLHVVSWQRPDGTFDDGGLGFPVHDAERPRFPDSSLHVWWDDLPGVPWLRGERLQARASSLQGAVPSSSIAQGHFRDWIAESFALAKERIRPPAPPNGEAWTITPDYRLLAKNISERRLVESGIRLSRLLNATLAP